MPHCRPVLLQMQKELGAEPRHFVRRGECWALKGDGKAAASRSPPVTEQRPSSGADEPSDSGDSPPKSGKRRRSREVSVEELVYLPRRAPKPVKEWWRVDAQALAAGEPDERPHDEGEDVVIDDYQPGPALGIPAVPEAAMQGAGEEQQQLKETQEQEDNTAKEVEGEAQQRQQQQPPAEAENHDCQGGNIYMAEAGPPPNNSTAQAAMDAGSSPGGALAEGPKALRKGDSSSRALSPEHAGSAPPPAAREVAPSTASLKAAEADPVAPCSQTPAEQAPALSDSPNREASPPQEAAAVPAAAPSAPRFVIPKRKQADPAPTDPAAQSPGPKQQKQQHQLSPQQLSPLAMPFRIPKAAEASPRAAEADARRELDNGSASRRPASREQQQQQQQQSRRPPAAEPRRPEAPPPRAAPAADPPWKLMLKQNASSLAR